MLISFAVENYRSIRNRVELSLEAINYYKEQPEQLLAPQLPGLAGAKFLRAAVVFGPNASGKSTLLEALNIMCNMVRKSAKLELTKALPYHPYALAASSVEEPTTFHVELVCAGIRFEYGFSYTKNIVVHEKLSAFPNGREQVWFTREAGAQSGGEEPAAPRVKGSKYVSIPASLRPLLNANMLLLSLLANYPGIAAARAVRPVFEWFTSAVAFVSRAPAAMADDFPYSGDIIDGVRGTDFQRAFIQEMLRKADVGILAARAEHRPFPSDDERLAELYRVLGEESVPKELKTIVFDHEGERGSAHFDISEESGGTYQLFVLSGRVAQALEGGGVLFVDELDASLHPVLACEVVRCFLSPESNPNGAQLVFTAHNPCLLEDGLLRRDQIWFTEKVDGATKLYPLSDFKPYKGESRVRGYLKGRYSATPVVPACFGMCNGFWSEDACGA